MIIALSMTSLQINDAPSLLIYSHEKDYAARKIIDAPEVEREVQLDSFTSVSRLGSTFADRVNSDRLIRLS
jgi:hypothetical protein